MQDPTRLIQNNRLRCKFEKNNTVLFFSLVDYRNNLFTSNEPEKILEFYNGFDNRDQLIQWMKERPKGSSYIHEVEGHKDIIVVIPTADFNGKYAINCRENIFKGLHMVFVESGGKGDFYFNFAHNCNVGIRRAMEYNPKWIVVSNDDIDKVSDTENLVQNLKTLEKDENDVIFLKHSNGYHSTPVRLYYGSTNTYFRFLLRKLFLTDPILSIGSKLTFTLIDTSNRSHPRLAFYDRIKLIIFRSLFLTYSKVSFYQIGAFGILSSQLIQKLASNIYDETYINGSEDIDLSLRLLSCAAKISFIDFKINFLVGETLGRGISRDLRSVVGRIYLFYKVNKI